MMTRNMVQIHGLPPFISWREAGACEAGGQAQGGPADASTGMTIHNDDRGSWAFNPLYSQWQLLHVVRSGDTLWALSGKYYGERSQAGVHLIGHVEQNRPILGSDYVQAIPGDVILIPDLAQPGAMPDAPPPPGAQPPPGGDPVAQPGDPPMAGTPGIVPGLPEQPPPGWPPGMPWPPLLVDPEPSDTPPGQQPGDMVETWPDPSPDYGGAEPVLTGGEIQPAPETKPQSWWTTTRIAMVGGLGVLTVGLIVWGATRGAKRPKRRSAPRRRRRR